jgi:DNA-binding CsgD family transcriptional regulator
MTLPTNIKAASAQGQAPAYRAAARPRSARAPGTANSTAVVRSIDRHDDAVITGQSLGSPAEADLSSLQAQAVGAMRAYVFAALDYAETLRDGAPSWGTAEVASLHRQGLSASERLDNFIDAVGRVGSLLSRHPNRPPFDISHVPAPQNMNYDDRRAAARLRDLTPRERNVLDLLLRGLANKQIAFELGIAEATAKAHVSAILHKLNVSNRARVIALFANIDNTAKPDFRAEN